VAPIKIAPIKINAKIEVDIRHGPGIVKTQKVTVVLVQIVHPAKIQNPRVFGDLPLTFLEEPKKSFADREAWVSSAVATRSVSLVPTLDQRMQIPMFMASKIQSRLRIGVVLSTLIFFTGLSGIVLANDSRVWSDASGRFKITATLVEVRDGFAWLKLENGKTTKISVDKLSAEDQEFLGGEDSPFEMVGEAPSSPKAAPARSSTPGSTTPSRSAKSASAGSSVAGSSGKVWAKPVVINWDNVELITPLVGEAFAVPEREATWSGELKRVALPKKGSNFESISSLVVDPKTSRAAVGMLTTFGSPKPATRVSLCDLASGKGIHSESVEAVMKPLTLIAGGAAVLMIGCGNERDKQQTADQLEVWRFDGQKVARSDVWIPFVDDKEERGKTANATVIDAASLTGNLVALLSDKGHLAVVDIVTRKPVWHMRLSDRNFAMAATSDGKVLAINNDKVVMVVDSATGETMGSTSVPDAKNMGWCHLAWNPKETKLLLSSIGDLRVLDTSTGEWPVDLHLSDAPVATKGVEFPDDDYALLNGDLLVHLPTRIELCKYSNAGAIKSVGGQSLIAILDGNAGVLVNAKFPQPAAEKMLANTKDDPSIFILHPGVGVAIDAQAAGAHQNEVRQSLENAAIESGYTIDSNSPIRIEAGITGPVDKAVSYIAAGSYIVKEYVSSIKITNGGNALWQSSGTNVPGALMTNRDETMQQALDRAGANPNLSMFGNVRFPNFMQSPKANASVANQSKALMNSKFTVQGLVEQ